MEVKVGYSIGTIHNKKEAIKSGDMGHPLESVIAFIHSHPGTSRDGELRSMGFDKFEGNQIHYITESDVGYKTNETAYQNVLYYTYFPESGNVWSVRSANIPAFIRNVNSYKGFFWGNPKHSIIMKHINISLLLVFSFVMGFSCTRKNNIVEKENDVQHKIVNNNGLHIYFFAEIKKYQSWGKIEPKDYYFIFKKTYSNDTLFQFSYFGLNDKAFRESGYKGFLEIDSFKIAIYDKENLCFSLYKDSIRTESFYNIEGYIVNNKEKEQHIFDEKGERVFETHMISMGRVNNNVFEVLSARTLELNDWNKYFE